MLSRFEILPTCFVKAAANPCIEKVSYSSIKFVGIPEFHAIRVDNWGATVEKIEEFVRVAARFQPQLANDI